MQLQTTRFGTIEIDLNEVITFTQPILGFQEYRRFILLPGPSAYLQWLQSTDSGELAFLIMNPKSLLPSYALQPAPHELTERAATTVEDLDIFTLVVIPADPSQIRTNLKAPILINPKHRLGKQTILDRSDYPVQYFLAQPQPSTTQPRETTNARSDA
ncbi:MAG TPA: flagellar assembly protein FliW [Candidatus Hydrogenedentes bacterium]|nr:flagellar assembly protein FliW [Candidatus Hydrogenedentota bacterium]